MSSRILFSVFLLSVAALTGCQGQTSEEPPIVPIRNMYNVPRFDPQAESAYFPDHRTMRPPVENTVAREMVVDEAVDTGVDDAGNYVLSIPEPVVESHGGMSDMLERGEERYGIYCAPCHGGLGDGQGMVPNVSEVAAIRPPTFHEDRIRHMPDGQLYATIRNGIRNMPSYRHNVSVSDRWAIVGYVRALQLSQMDGRTTGLIRDPSRRPGGGTHPPSDRPLVEDAPASPPRGRTELGRVALAGARSGDATQAAMATPEMEQ